MKNFFLVTIIILTLFFSTSCKEDEVIPPPEIAVTDVSKHSSTSAFVTIRFKKGQDGQSYFGGVVVGSLANVTIENGIMFEADILFTGARIMINNLNPDEKYYIRGFYQTDDSGPNYGESVEYKTSSPSSVKIENDSLKRGVPIYFTGIDLSTDSVAYDINVDAFQCNIIFAGADSAVFEMPLSTTPGIHKLNISINGFQVIERPVYVMPWSQINTLPFYVLEEGFMFGFEDEVYSLLDKYVLDYNDDNEIPKTNELWKLNLKKNKWEHIPSPFPGEYRKWAKTVTLNGKGYLCMG
ncbi:MAG: hypothetical protein R3345_15360, partial [Fulvivirga sp.]|nr:hypothetical protein [Fulvivirga sp.]